MKAAFAVALLATVALGSAIPTSAQTPRQDVIWARSTAGQPITLDGVLDEPAWASAETWVLRWAEDNGIPGSGYKSESPNLPSDPSYATIRLLSDGGQIYLGVEVQDASVGGSKDFNRFDGLLMTIMDRGNANRPLPPLEHFYSWWYPTDLNATDPGKDPAFVGAWAEWPPGTPRDSTQVARWDAVTVVHGLSNSDAVLDEGYTVEMRFNVEEMGYDLSKPDGEIVEWSISLYDCDWLWPLDVTKFSSNRTWWQNPWGNTSWYGEVKVHTRPDVTIFSGPVPVVEPDVRIPNASGFLSPVIDGQLSEPVWAEAPTLDIRYGDATLRDSYTGVGPFRSGQFQPEVNGGVAALIDPGDATVSWFFKADTLYLGFDVRDLVVQYRPEVDRWDGFVITINDRAVRSSDNTLLSRRLSFQVGPDGNVLAQDYLPFLRDSLQGARVALQLKGGTTVDTLGVQPDSGYTAELAIDLTKLGYPPGRGDGALFIGINLFDGDSFTPFTDSYATRTWWFREYEGENGPAWAYLDPLLGVVGVADQPLQIPQTTMALRGNQPNPFANNTLIQYSIAEAGVVSIEVFDLQGRRVQARSMGLQEPGPQRFIFNRGGLANGLYLYRLRLADAATGATRAMRSGKMLLVE